VFKNGHAQDGGIDETAEMSKWRDRDLQDLNEIGESREHSNDHNRKDVPEPASFIVGPGSLHSPDKKDKAGHDERTEENQVEDVPNNAIHKFSNRRMNKAQKRTGGQEP